MTVSTLLIFLAGLALLVIGADLLVRGASRLAVAVGISPLVVGLTVVALGTSAPEFAVSIQSAVTAREAIALGNVVGSNIFNILLILGLAAVITPLVVARQLIRLDVPLMIAVSVLLMALALDGLLGLVDGLALMLGLALYLTWTVRKSREETLALREEDEELMRDAKSIRGMKLVVQIVLVLVGLGLLVIGARWLVDSAVEIARAVGLSELVIGLTVVALGTSAPEIATCVVASIRGERDMAVGNVVGSNLFNILGVIGVSAVVAPVGIVVPAAALNFDIPVMIVVAVACLPIFFTGHRIGRWEGALFLAYFVAYLAYLILDAGEHDALPLFSNIMMAFVLPLTGITLLVLVWRAVRTEVR